MTEGRNARRLWSNRSPQRNKHHLGILPSIKEEAEGLSFWPSLQVIRFAGGLKYQGIWASPGAWWRLGAAGSSLQLFIYTSLSCCQYGLSWQVLQVSSSIERSCILQPPPGAHGSCAAPALGLGMLPRSLDCCWIPAAVPPGFPRGPMDINCDNRLLQSPCIVHVRKRFYLFPNPQYYLQPWKPHCTSPSPNPQS